MADNNPSRWSHSTGEADKKARSITSSLYSGNSGSGATAYATPVGQSLATVLSSGTRARERRRGGTKAGEEQGESAQDALGSRFVRVKEPKLKKDDVRWVLEDGTKMKADFGSWVSNENGTVEYWDEETRTGYYVFRSEWDSMPSTSKSGQGGSAQDALGTRFIHVKKPKLKKDDVRWILEDGTKMKVDFGSWVPKENGTVEYWDEETRTGYYMFGSEWDSMPSTSKSKSGQKHDRK